MQLANTAQQLVQVGKSDLWITSGSSAVEVVELPRPRLKEEGGGEQTSVHTIAEEMQLKTKTGQATTGGGMTKKEVTGPGRRHGY